MVLTKDYKGGMYVNLQYPLAEVMLLGKGYNKKRRGCVQGWVFWFLASLSVFFFSFGGGAGGGGGGGGGGVALLMFVFRWAHATLITQVNDKMKEDHIWFWHPTGNGTSGYIRSACRR